MEERTTMAVALEMILEDSLRFEKSSFETGTGGTYIESSSRCTRLYNSEGSKSDILWDGTEMFSLVGFRYCSVIIVEKSPCDYNTTTGTSAYLMNQLVGSHIALSTILVKCKSYLVSSWQSTLAVLIISNRWENARDIWFSAIFVVLRGKQHVLG